MSFKRFDPEDITISAESIVAPAWSNQQSTLTSFFTSPSQISSLAGTYYYEVYQTGSTVSGASTQFSLAYGNRKGSGSDAFDSGIPDKTPSKTIYGQYRTLLNGDEDSDFVFGTTTPDSIFVISVNRSKFKERLLPGTFTLKLGSSNGTLTLTDNSRVVSTVSYTDAGRVFDIVSGSAGTVFTGNTTTGITPNSGSYGKLYPDVGVIILNGDALKGDFSNSKGLGISINETTSGTYTGISNYNLKTGFGMIVSGSNFTLQSEETVTSNYVFVRVRNSEFNYSTNPSNITGSGELRHDVMINSPQAFITTV